MAQSRSTSGLPGAGLVHGVEGGAGMAASAGAHCPGMGTGR